MGDFRARDTDRDRSVEVIEAAYVDGQIGDADRELRVSRALTAETLDELSALTRDLQPPTTPATPVARATPAYAARPAPSPNRARRLLVTLVIAGVGIAGLAVAAVLLTVVAGTVTTTSDSSGEGVVRSEEAVEVRSFDLTPGSVRAFVRAYEAKFGTLEAYEVGFFPDRVQAQVPVRGSRPRMERWTWDGQWRRDAAAAAVMGPYRRVDVGAVQVRRLFANIDRAKRDLQVEQPRFTHALLAQWGDQPVELNIYVGNGFGESGYLSTTPAGEVLRAFPYEP